MALWTPGLLSPALWFDAADAPTLAVDGSNNISQWAEKSENLRHASGVGAAQPLLVADGLNGMSVVEFAANDLMTHALVDLSATGFTFAILWKPTSATANKQIFGVDGNGYMYLQYNNTWYVGTSSRSVAHSDWALKIGSYAAGSAKTWTNGAYHGAVSGTIAAAYQKTQCLGLSGYAGIQGRAAEIVIIPGELSGGDRQNLEGSILHKWGLAANLPADHPHKDAAPLAPFFGRFYGTIRDKTGALAQRRVIATLDGSGECVGTLLSDPVTGEYELETLVDEPHTLIFTGEADRNALVYTGVMPEEIP